MRLVKFLGGILATEKKHSNKRPVVGFYWRKLIFFTLSFIFLGASFSTIKIFKADVNTYAPPTNSSNLSINIDIQNDGSILVDGKKISTRIDSTGDYDEMILPILDSSGMSYDNVNVKVNLPASVADLSSYDIKGIHGVGSANVTKQDQRTIEYSATQVGPAATLSLILRMPKNTVGQPLVLEVYCGLTGVKSNIWLVFAIGLPALTLLFMVIFIVSQGRHQHIDQPDKETDSPPMTLPPAIVGVLYNQKVRSQEIAATLIDLATRGDIYIMDRERDFAFAKNRMDQRLLSYEKILLSKIFKENIVSDRAEIEQRINNHLYSRKISLVTSGIYVIATRLGYFKVNPQRTHRTYRLYGIIGFLIGLGGFVLSLVYFTNPPYIAFFWIGMIFSSLIVMAASKYIPNRTPLGREALSNWLAFRKYLSNPDKIAFSYQSQEIFQKYLPYAIVLDCEVAWAKRFSEQNFILPEWFVTDQGDLGLQDFCLSLFPLVSYVARSLAAIKEPGFE